MTAQSALSTVEYAEAVAPRPGRAHRVVAEWRLLTCALVGFDLACIAAAFAAAYLVRFKTGVPLLETPAHSLEFYYSVSYWAIPVWVIVFALYRLYDRHFLFEGFQEYTKIIEGCTAGTMIVIVMSFVDTTLIISRGWLMLVLGLSVVFVGGSRFALRRVLRRLRSRGFLVARTLIVGANEEAKALAEQLISNPGAGAQVVGLVDGSSRWGDYPTSGLPIVGTFGDLERLVEEHEVSEVVVATTALAREQLLDLVATFSRIQGVEIRLSSGLFEILTTGVSVQQISCIPLMTPQRVRIVGIDAALKSFLDYMGAMLGVVVLSPLLVIVALLIRLDSPGPILHRRNVLGRTGKPFDAFKFRTMVANADAVLASDTNLRSLFEARQKLSDDPRVTKLGRMLRRTSLDELPQLFNVLRGEMSLVGPRMISPEEASRYGKWELNLLTVKPGITGPWQVHGRSDIPYEERVRLSMQYIRNYSIWLDLEILLRTVPVVLTSRGAY